MPKGTEEELKLQAEIEADKAALKAKVDRLANHEYETDNEIAEIKKHVAGVKSDEIDADSLAKLAADVDTACKRIDEMAEQLKEARAKGIPTEEDEDPVEATHLGQVMAEMRELTHYGKKGVILEAIGGDDGKLKQQGVKLPDHIKELFSGRPKAIQKTTGYLEEGQGSMGGFTVADTFVPMLMSYPLMEPIVRSRAYQINATGNVATVPRINESDRSTPDVHGGVHGYWTAEGGSISVSNPTFGQAVLTAKKLALLTYCSNELLDDSALPLNDVLVRLFSEALAWFEDRAFINGSGVNECLGIRNAPCAQASSTTTTSTAFALADAGILLSELMPGSELSPSTVWIMNARVRRVLVQLSSTTDSAGWFRGALSIKDSPAPWRLFGIPIYFSEHTAAFGTDEDIILADLSYYLVLPRQDIRAAVSTDARFANNETGYRLTMRSDGQPWPSSNLTLADGSTTVSPFVLNNHA